MVFALKSVRQSLANPSLQLLELMNEFRSIVNDCIRIRTRNRRFIVEEIIFARLFHNEGKVPFLVPSDYRLTAISKAAGILSSRKKSRRRGTIVKDPYLKKPLLVSCYHFRINNHSLFFRISKKR